MKIAKVKRLLPIAICVIVIALVVGILYINFAPHDRKAAVSLIAVPIHSAQTTNAVVPARLQIPKIKVDAAIDQMGILQNGLLEAPTGPKTVGWYKFGPRPGEVGSAVIDGHYGRWANGEGSVFDKLNTLKKGDSLSVVDSKGTITMFIVRELKTYDPKADDSAVFHSNDGRSHLNLITCDGSWSSNSQSYSRRLVVFADKK